MLERGMSTPPNMSIPLTTNHLDTPFIQRADALIELSVRQMHIRRLQQRTQKHVRNRIYQIERVLSGKFKISRTN